MERQLIEEWFELYERDVTSFLIYYTGSMDVQDLVQETFLRGMKKIAHFREGSHPKTWLITIAKNLVIDRARKNNIWNRIKYLLRDEKQTENLDHTILLGELNRELYIAINRLPAKNKEVIILKAILEMTSKQVGEILGANENHVNVLYHRSLKKLKSILETEGFEYEARTR
ncbi:RNA polymerase sigma factor [Psychrobacillus sp. FSL K6-1267]|uniref:RNA polymerase sigma factor n=1 Tax=Psychrobacillus sp. FSL K6-1267 TaxID=2921543 RepID=UPI00119E84A8|nr:sigma-70 family RNA polymerase sigma factor [Bacillus sp. N3536]